MTEDFTAPEILSVWMSDDVIDVIDGPAQVTVRIEVQDADSGVDPESFKLDPQNFRGGDPISPQAMTLISGDALRGTYETTFTFPEFIRSGDWIFSANVADHLGNRVEQTSSGVGLYPRVVSLDDEEAPLVTAKLSDSILDITDGPAELKITVEAHDAGVGIAPDAQVMISDHLGNGGTGRSIVNSSDDPHRGNFVATISYAKHDSLYDERGIHTYSYGNVWDMNANSTGWRGNIGTVTIATRPLRGKRPALALNEGLLLATWASNPDLLGVLEYEVEFAGPTGPSSVRTVATEASIGPSGGLYTAKVRARNKLGWGEWTSTSEAVATPHTVSPDAVIFEDNDGTKEDTFTVPVSAGVEYLVGETVTAAGTYPGSGIVSVTARAKTDYVLAQGASAEWSHEFKATPFPVTPDAVVFTDKDGTTEDTYTVPVTEGVEYFVADKVTAAGTYQGSGTVAVKARAVTDYVLAPGASVEWSHEFKATPYAVTPAAVEFRDRDGTKEDSYTIPVTDGVEYLIGETVTAAGTYPGAGSVTVKARAATDYVLAPGASAEWSHEFKATPYPVTPGAVVFNDKDGTAEDTYTVPVTEGVEYLVGDKLTAAGTYPGSGTIAVTARAKTDYVLTQGASAAWSHEFKTTPYQVIPVAVVFTDKDGTAEDTFTVPVTEGVEYLVGDKVTAAGTYPGSGTVTVTARAKTDYVLAQGAAAEWSQEFKATPYQVTPAAVVLTDKEGTAEDTYVVPVTEGVEYVVGGNVVAAGMYPGSGSVSVTARAKTDYVLAPGAAAEWSHEFKATPYQVTPPAVIFTDEDGTAQDTYTVPATEGVEYLVGDKATAAGTYPGSGTVTVKARAVTDYVLAPGAAAEWSHEFKATPYTVTPAAVDFTDLDGTKDDSYTIPVTDGVEYLVGETVTVAGTYPGTGTVTVTARATTDHVLADGAAAVWTHAFESTSAEYVPPAVSPFVDVSTVQQFYREMAWLAEQKISTGWDEGNGVRSYRPLQAINRDAMAAFLYRMAGSPDYAAPAVSPFADVSTGQQFYREMAWLAEQKISTGWDEGNGVRTYRPLQAINRDAMAAFLYRMAGSPEYAAPAVSPFADVSTGQQFYKEMAWLAEQKISTGWDEGNGVRSYRPLQAINRDAMAAFLYRLMGLAA
ncbi:S-layer homology domain-containing protein [Pseudarthrobacter quantipunctorum]|uniref:S-layer homology domain-containing protein n=1 Tax=Pseudarthrobacter quantipunctorum TaxID=3128980 RepID=A0ABZ2RCX0_9MICC